MVDGAGIGGYVAPGFEPVREAFERNFAEHGELGAAFAAVRDGEPVVDLWGGLADRAAGRLWAQDTLQMIFSGTKGLVAMCLLLLIDRGQLELDAPVARWWPEFAVAGKEAVTVRDVVTHRARLAGFAEPLTVADLVDDVRLAALLAAQAQLEDPRAVDVYHPLTYGWLCGELVRRVDGRSVGRFLAEELVAPLGLELHLGLPAELEPCVARLELADGWGGSATNDPAAAERDPLMRTVWANPPTFWRETFAWNEPTLHAAELPGVNAIGTARSVARLYGALDRFISPETLLLGRTALARRHDPLLDVPQTFGVGFQLQSPLMPFGPPADAFGHGGAGGSIHGAWPSERVAFSYAMNLMRDDEDEASRAGRLLTALHASVTKVDRSTNLVR